MTFVNKYIFYNLLFPLHITISNLQLTITTSKWLHYLEISSSKYNSLIAHFCILFYLYFYFYYSEKREILGRLRALAGGEQEQALQDIANQVYLNYKVLQRYWDKHIYCTIIVLINYMLCKK